MTTTTHRQQALDWVFDADAVSGVVGRPARLGHLRFKPDAGVTAALLTPDGRPDGWLRLLAPDGWDKVVNARRRAARRGLEVPDARVGDLIAMWGPLDTDPGLARALEKAGPPLWTSADVLRHNPLRRLVVRVERAGEVFVGRLTAQPQDALVAAHEQVAATVPVVRRARPDLPRSSRVTWWHWYGDGDLTAHPDPAADRAAGAAIAALHRLTGPTVPDVRADLPDRLQANVRLLATLDPALADRLGAVVTDLLPRLADGDAVALHGDLSPDQVFVGPQGIRIGDFDRCTRGPAAADLGSYAAVASAASTQAFLAGYAEAGGPLPSPRELDAWASCARVLRVLEPFRAADQDWRRPVAATIHDLEDPT